MISVDIISIREIISVDIISIQGMMDIMTLEFFVINKIFDT